MEIKYKTTQIKNICENYGKAKKEHGADVAERLFSAIDFIKAAPSVIDIRNYPPFHSIRFKVIKRVNLPLI